MTGLIDGIGGMVSTIGWVFIGCMVGFATGRDIDLPASSLLLPLVPVVVGLALETWADYRIRAEQKAEVEEAYAALAEYSELVTP